MTEIEEKIFTDACKKAEFVVGGRYGYHAVDLECTPESGSSAIVETVITGITKKEAEIIAMALNRTLHGEIQKNIVRWCKPPVPFRIENEHKKQFDFIKENNIRIGTRLRVHDFDGDKIKTVKWINPHYGWFGETDQIQLKDIKKVLKEE